MTVRLVAAEEIDELIRHGVIRHAAAISAWHLYVSLAARPDSRPR